MPSIEPALIALEILSNVVDGVMVRLRRPRDRIGPCGFFLVGGRPLVHRSDSAGDHVINPEPPPERQEAKQGGVGDSEASIRIPKGEARVFVPG